jgi:2-polyprenyl-3-methyl-5-hydroxy-6-metoxy-1,4-benzoquinol methylase
MGSTKDAAYTERLAGLERGWKRLLDVQRPYREHLRRLAPGRFLEVGCGLGRNLQNARGFAEGLGIDHNPDSVAVARARGLQALTTEEFHRSPLAVPGAFDTLLVSHVLEHLTREEALGLLRTYLPFVKAGGQVIVVTPQEAGYRSDPTHVTFVDLPACARLLAEAGVAVERQESFPFPRWVGRLFTYNEFVTVGSLPAGPRSPATPGPRG